MKVYSHRNGGRSALHQVYESGVDSRLGLRGYTDIDLDLRLLSRRKRLILWNVDEDKIPGISDHFGFSDIEDG